jgi:hypothetical protein
MVFSQKRILPILLPRLSAWRWKSIPNTSFLIEYVVERPYP